MPSRTKLALVPTLAASVAAATVQFQINVNNDSWDTQGSFFNDVLTINAATAAGLASGSRVDIIGIGWSLTVDTFSSGSWLSEASILFSDPHDFPIDFEAFTITPGAGDNYSGQKTYSSGGIIILQSQGLDNEVLDNGMLRVEFFETFDDFPAEVDAHLTGTITILTSAIQGPCSGADLAPPYGTLDLADITAFITAFQNQDPAADLADPHGTWDLHDIVAFITAFGAGCP